MKKSIRNELKDYFREKYLKVESHIKLLVVQESYRFVFDDDNYVKIFNSDAPFWSISVRYSLPHIIHYKVRDYFAKVMPYCLWYKNHLGYPLWYNVKKVPHFYSPLEAELQPIKRPKNEEEILYNKAVKAHYDWISEQKEAKEKSSKAQNIDTSDLYESKRDMLYWQYMKQKADKGYELYTLQKQAIKSQNPLPEHVLAEIELYKNELEKEAEKIKINEIIRTNIYLKRYAINN